MATTTGMVARVARYFDIMFQFCCSRIMVLDTGVSYTYGTAVYYILRHTLYLH